MVGRNSRIKQEIRGLTGWILLAGVVMISACSGAACQQACGKDTIKTMAETTIPDDSFCTQTAGLPAQTGQGEENTAPGDAQTLQETAPPSGQADQENPTEPAMALKICCLTFDDGPSATTAQVLDILAEEDVPATFFVTAQDCNTKYIPLLGRTVGEGHQVAMHSATHSYSKIYASTEAFWLDIKELRQQISPYVDVDAIRWLRFPGGSTNTVSHRYGGRQIMKQLIEQSKEKGYHWIDWNVCAGDATAAHPDADGILQNVKNDAKGRDICVVLMHDTKETTQTVKALPAIIDYFRENGYHFFTIEQMYEERDGG